MKNAVDKYLKKFRTFLVEEHQFTPEQAKQVSIQSIHGRHVVFSGLQYDFSSDEYTSDATGSSSNLYLSELHKFSGEEELHDISLQSITGLDVGKQEGMTFKGLTLEGAVYDYTEDTIALKKLSSDDDSVSKMTEEYTSDELKKFTKSLKTDHKKRPEAYISQVQMSLSAALQRHLDRRRKEHPALSFVRYMGDTEKREKKTEALRKIIADIASWEKVYSDNYQSFHELGYSNVGIYIAHMTWQKVYADANASDYALLKEGATSIIIQNYFKSHHQEIENTTIIKQQEKFVPTVAKLAQAMWETCLEINAHEDLSQNFELAVLMNALEPGLMRILLMRPHLVMEHTIFVDVEKSQSIWKDGEIITPTSEIEVKSFQQILEDIRLAVFLLLQYITIDSIHPVLEWLLEEVSSCYSTLYGHDMFDLRSIYDKKGKIPQKYDSALTPYDIPLCNAGTFISALERMGLSLETTAPLSLIEMSAMFKACQTEISKENVIVQELVAYGRKRAQIVTMQELQEQAVTLVETASKMTVPATDTSHRSIKNAWMQDGLFNSKNLQKKPAYLFAITHETLKKQLGKIDFSHKVWLLEEIQAAETKFTTEQEEHLCHGLGDIDSYLANHFAGLMSSVLCSAKTNELMRDKRVAKFIEIYLQQHHDAYIPKPTRQKPEVTLQAATTEKIDAQLSQARSTGDKLTTVVTLLWQALIQLHQHHQSLHGDMAFNSGCYLSYIEGRFRRMLLASEPEIMLRDMGRVIATLCQEDYKGDCSPALNTIMDNMQKAVQEYFTGEILAPYTTQEDEEKFMYEHVFDKELGCFSLACTDRPPKTLTQLSAQFAQGLTKITDFSHLTSDSQFFGDSLNHLLELRACRTNAALLLLSCYEHESSAIQKVTKANIKTFLQEPLFQHQLPGDSVHSNKVKDTLTQFLGGEFSVQMARNLLSKEKHTAKNTLPPESISSPRPPETKRRLY